jgi:replicative DNA helicase
MLRDSWAREEATKALTGPEMGPWRHEAIWDAIVELYSRGLPVDVNTVAHQLGNQLPRVGGLAELFQLNNDGLAVVDPRYYIDQVAKHALVQRLRSAHTRLGQLVETAELNPDIDQAGLVAALDDAVTPVREHTVPGIDRADTIPGQNIDDFLAGEDDPYDWLVPGVLERQDRLILTAGEGKGKSTLCRQLGVQMAAGIHPFTGERIQPIKVLIVDLENTRRQSRRKLRPLRLQAGKELDPTQIVIECRTGGIDLRDSTDRAWLNQIVTHHKPDLLITGPIYKMASGDPNDEKDSKPVALAIDSLREAHDLAVILEAHTRKAEGNNPKHRAKEPFGWSGWMRWPEFGLHLSDDGEITHWRGPRDERDFPHQLNRGGTWPWSAEMTIANQNWVKVRTAIRDAGRRLTAEELTTPTGMSRATVYRTLNEHSADLATLLYELEMDES